MKITKTVLTAVVLCLSYALLASAEEFRLGIGPPAAVSSPNGMKKVAAVLAVRVEGCPEPAKARVSGTAEGLVRGERRSVPLALNALTTPGTYWVEQNWPADGVWVINLNGAYNNLKASAIVPIGPKGFLREPSKFYPRAATGDEIDAALQALATQSTR